MPKKPVNKILSKYWQYAIFLAVSIVFANKIIFFSGLPFKYDWYWPIFDMSRFWSGLFADGSFGIFTTFSRLGPAILGFFGLINFPPSALLKIFIIFVHFTAAYGFYSFIKTRVKSEIVAIVSALAYAFTPYIFIRTIVGFIWSLVAYAVLPIFLQRFFQPKKSFWHYFGIGLLLSLIFSQNQAGILVLLIITVHFLINLFGKQRKAVLINYILTISALFLFAIPWLAVMIFKGKDLSAVSGAATTTLNFIASLPHSMRSFLMLSDHQITVNFFYPLAHNKFYILGWMIVWFVAFCSVFNKQNRRLIAPLIISSIIIFPFIKGPTGIFGGFYTWFFSRVPQVAIFRETYHFEFLYAIVVSLLFAFGLDWLWKKISKLKSKKPSGELVKTALKTFFAASAIFIIAPYLTFDYAGYLQMQKMPSEYSNLHDFLSADKEYCTNIFYPPGTGFIYYKDDKSTGASNSDTIAGSLRIPYLTDGASVLSVPSEAMFFRNELISQFLNKEDNGEFVALMKEGNIDCALLRLDTESKYWQASNLWRETDPAIVKKWNQTDLKKLADNKKGLVLDKKFGENIYIYKIDKQYQVSSIKYQGERQQQVGKPAREQFDNKTIQQLPLADWATNFAYYKDGWSRGRYDFWRKLLFAQLRQDFLYTDKQDSALIGKVDKDGQYELWVRYLTGGTPGNFQILISENQFNIFKDAGGEKFIWKNLGDIIIEKESDIEIKNIVGENAVADIVLVAKN